MLGRKDEIKLDFLLNYPYVRYVMIDDNQTLEIMSFTNFDRHANMSSETLNEIMDLTQYRPDGNRLPMMVRNKLSGLFDGFLYDSLLDEVKELEDEELTSRVEAVIETVSNYPQGQTQVF